MVGDSKKKTEKLKEVQEVIVSESPDNFLNKLNFFNIKFKVPKNLPFKHKQIIFVPRSSSEMPNYYQYVLRLKKTVTFGLVN